MSSLDVQAGLSGPVVWVSATVATEGTAAYIRAEIGLPVETVTKKLSEGHPNVVDVIVSGRVSAVINTVASASFMRSCSASAEKPPKTTLWVAPMRAQASIAIAASGIIGR